MHSKHFCAMLFVNIEIGICCTHVVYLDMVTSHAEKNSTMAAAIKNQQATLQWLRLFFI